MGKSVGMNRQVWVERGKSVAIIQTLDAPFMPGSVLSSGPCKGSLWSPVGRPTLITQP